VFDVRFIEQSPPCGRIIDKFYNGNRRRCRRMIIPYPLLAAGKDRKF
jgi:hypothetical protein